MSHFSHFLNLFLYLTIIFWFLLEHHFSCLCLPSTLILANSFVSRISITHLIFCPLTHLVYWSYPFWPYVASVFYMGHILVITSKSDKTDMGQEKIMGGKLDSHHWSQRATGSWPCHQLLDMISLDIIYHNSFLHAYRQLFPRTERKWNPNFINYFKNSET